LNALNWRIFSAERIITLLLLEGRQFLRVYSLSSNSSNFLGTRRNEDSLDLNWIPPLSFCAAESDGMMKL
jgi:hypothetical protein